MKSFLIGLGLGVGLGILFAPMSGEETRNNLADRANDLASSARESYEHNRDRVQRGVQSIRGSAERAMGRARTAASEVTQATGTESPSPSSIWIRYWESSRRADEHIVCLFFGYASSSNQLRQRGTHIMQVLENWHPQGVTVYMDDKRFVKCVLTDCKLVYGGGDVTWENTQFVNCQLSFDGAAQRTVAYLQNFGLMKPPVTNASPSAQPNSGVN
jgi:gas vesicle protein